jgi:acyl-CoA thioesterase
MIMDTSPETMDPQTLAEKTTAQLWSQDAATQGLGMSLARVAPGQAVLRMTVQPHMLNGHQTCHGGYLFTLADSAFAFACNNRNQNTVAAACSIDFLAPARLGDTLEAEAIEKASAGRSGVYDVTVRIAGGPTVALFRGKSHTIKGTVL